MTAEELAEVLKTVNANRPQVTQTMNFNAPIGQQIAHVDKIEAHFDKDMGMQITNADEVSKQGVQNVVPAADDGVMNRDAIPSDCTEAVKKVIVPTFTIDGGVVLNSAKQIAKSTEQVDLTSNVEVAMLMSVCVEVGAIKPSTTCPDFVRALIGMRLIEFTDNAAISRMASGMTKKLNGSVKNGKRTPALPANHLRWPSDYLPVGIRLYETMRTQV